MKTVALKAKLPLLVVATFLVVLAMTVIKVNAAPISCASGVAGCPYFVTSGGDVFAGGWFASGSTCQAANYQNGNYSGAIMAFGNGRSGAGSNLGALALGLIEGSAASNYGFYSSPGPSNNSLSFANNAAGIGSNLGGMFEGSTSLSNCIPDYATNNVGSATAVGSINPSADANGTHTIGATTIGALTVPASKNVAYFINGDLTINGNVTYAAHTTSNAPKFVVVVRGNIYINHNVDRLDGWYIAEPTGGINGGEIWTCRDGASGSIDDSWVRPNCDDKALVINGALTAKQVNFGRITNGGNPLPATPAETINYTSDMVTGGPFFYAQNKNAGKIQSLITLPPVF